MSSERPYSGYFHLTNKDPHNYVLYKDFFFYSVIAVYIFYFWLLITVLMNHEELERTDYGTTILVFNIIILVGTFLILAISFFNRENFPYSLAGIIFLLLLIEIILLVYYFDKKDLDPDYVKDPTSVAITFLIVYAFVSYFDC